MSNDTPTHDAPDAKGNWKAAGVVLLVIFGFSVALGGLLFRNYAQFMNYAHKTLTHPETPPPWKADPPLSPEGCVQAALDWAEDCKGVKSLCDEYVTRVTQECMIEDEHVDYCFGIEDATASSHFGAEECAARGARRNIDAEACGNAYRAIDSHCQYVRDKVRVERGEKPEGPRKSSGR